MEIAFSKFVFVTVSAAVFIVANRVLGKRADSEWRYAVGLILALALILPVDIQLFRVEIPESGAEQITAGGAEYGEQLNFPTAKPPLPGFSESEPAPAPSEPAEQNAKGISFYAEAAVWFVYALGASVALFSTVYRYCRAVKPLQRCGRAPSERENEIYLCLCEKYGFRKAPVLRVCPAFAIGSSVTFGFFRQTVLIADKFGEEDYALILEHELTHCKRRDSFSKAMLALLCAVYWFNPVIHLFAGEMHILCEESCDEKLLKNSGFDEKKRYCRLLVEAACTGAGRKNIMSAFEGGKRIMKKRIENIFSKKSKLITALVLATVVLVAALTSAIYIDTPPDNIKVAYFTEPQQLVDVSYKKDVIENYCSDNYYNIKYNYSVDSDKIEISGVVNGVDFNVVGEYAGVSYNGARIFYWGEETTGNYDLKFIRFEYSQTTPFTELPLPDEKHPSNHTFMGWFGDYARENTKYKNVLEVNLNPKGTDDLVVLEVFLEDNFVKDYITNNNIKYEFDIEIQRYEGWNVPWVNSHIYKAN